MKKLHFPNHLENEVFPKSQTVLPDTPHQGLMTETSHLQFSPGKSFKPRTERCGVVFMSDRLRISGRIFPFTAYSLCQRLNLTKANSKVKLHHAYSARSLKNRHQLLKSMMRTSDVASRETARIQSLQTSSV